MAVEDLHGLAVSAEAALEALATGLGEAGAPPETVQGVTQMADVTRQVVKALGEPQPDEEVPAGEPLPPEAAPLPPEAAPAPGPQSIGGAVEEGF